MKLILTIAAVFILSSFSPRIIIQDTSKAERHEIKSSDFDNSIILKLRDATGWVVNEGTIIHEKWILTAAHGLSSVEPNQTIMIHGQQVSIKEIFIHPDWDGEFNDLALIKLNEKVNVPHQIHLFENRDETGSEIILVGHGMFGTGYTGPTEDDGKFRMATNKIDSVSDSYIMFRFDEPEHPNSTELEGISGPSDSGGPAFIRTKKGLELVGVSSHQDNIALGVEEGKFGVVEYYTRVSTFVPWIKGVINGTIENEPSKNKNAVVDWRFGESTLSERVSKVMLALVNSDVNSEIIENQFTESFQKSTDLNQFLQAVSGLLENPTVSETKKIKPNLISFIVNNDNGKVYYFQFDGEKRTDYLISGMTVKKIN